MEQRRMISHYYFFYILLYSDASLLTFLTSFCMFKIFILSVVTALVNANLHQTSYLNVTVKKMLIDRIKTAFKAAIRSGKIYSLASKKPTRDYNEFNATELLSNNTWDYFISKELRFRKHLSSKKVNYGDFVSKGDIKLWVKVIKIFVSIFYKNNVCLLTEQNEHWSTSLLKYVFRILKTMPNDPDAVVRERL